MSTPKGLKPFQGRYKGGRFVQISHDMIKSPAWKKLSPIAKELYTYMLTKYKGDALTFTCSYKEIKNEVGQGWNSISSALKGLIEGGFIKVIENNKNRWEMNVYKHSDEWSLSYPLPDIANARKNFNKVQRDA